jgi:hypothetical protein|tara:strand:+ start:120 stop:551 length:432 start_codon:yes stop_codon:yes gene_type:complete
MKSIKHWKKKGFFKAAELFTSSRLTQGVDVELSCDREAIEDHPGVYLIVHKGKVLKVGQSSNLYARIYTQYKGIVNSTNNFVREEIKRKYNSVEFYVLPTSKEMTTVAGYTFMINLQKGLEEAMLKGYWDKYQDIPKLNRQKN